MGVYIDVYSKICTHFHYFSPFISPSRPRPQVPLKDLLHPSVPPEAVDLLSSLLVFNPDHRLTAEQALEHPYVAR